MSPFEPPAVTGEDPILRAVCAAACIATGATSAWVAAVQGDELQVVAASGALADRVRGRTVALGGSAGFVVSTGQPMAVAPRPGDHHTGAGVLGAIEVVPSSLCALPCMDGDEATGVLELVDKAGGGRFGFEDVELGALFASIAGPALDARGAAPAPPTVESLAAHLRVLAADDAIAYRHLAWVVQRLLVSA